MTNGFSINGFSLKGFRALAAILLLLAGQVAVAGHAHTHESDPAHEQSHDGGHCDVCRLAARDQDTALAVLPVLPEAAQSVSRIQPDRAIYQVSDSPVRAYQGRAPPLA